MTFKRFNASHSTNYNTGEAFEQGTLTWNPDQGLRLHDGTTIGGNAVGVSNFYDLTNKPQGTTAIIDLIGGASSTNIGKFMKQTDMSNSDWSSVTLTDLNITDGTSGQVLTTDGAGSYSFTTPSVSGTSLPADASGYLNNNGSGTLTWVSGNPADSGSPSYSDIWVLSDKGVDVNFWSSYTLTGTVKQLFDFNNTGTLTLTAQQVYGKQVAAGSKTLIINNGKIQTNSYGIVIEFPSNPAVGETFTSPITGTTSTTIAAGSFVPGQTYTIVEVGTTSWASIGATASVIGHTFIATGVGAGTGTASISNGVTKLIFKPATGQTAFTLQQGQSSSVSVQFGEGTSIIATYVDIAQMGGQPIAWVYAGIINSVPTWYQLYL